MIELPDRYESEAIVLLRLAGREPQAVSVAAPGRVEHVGQDAEGVRFQPDPTGRSLPMAVAVAWEDVIRVDGTWLRDDVELNV